MHKHMYLPTIVGITTPTKLSAMDRYYSDPPHDNIHMYVCMHIIYICMYLHVYLPAIIDITTPTKLCTMNRDYSVTPHVLALYQRLGCVYICERDISKRRRVSRG